MEVRIWLWLHFLSFGGRATPVAPFPTFLEVALGLVAFPQRLSPTQLAVGSIIAVTRESLAGMAVDD